MELRYIVWIELEEYDSRDSARKSFNCVGTVNCSSALFFFLQRKNAVFKSLFVHHHKGLPMLLLLFAALVQHNFFGALLHSTAESGDSCTPKIIFIYVYGVAH